MLEDVQADGIRLSRVDGYAIRAGVNAVWRWVLGKEKEVPRNVLAVYARYRVEAELGSRSNVRGLVNGSFALLVRTDVVLGKWYKIKSIRVDLGRVTLVFSVEVHAKSTQVALVNPHNLCHKCFQMEDNFTSQLYPMFVERSPLHYLALELFIHLGC